MTSRIRPPAYSRDLEGKRVFLSASFPSRERAAVYFESASPFETTDAVVAAARAILGAAGRLVFGGHPTITPLVLSVARDYVAERSPGASRLVQVYQSRLFEESEEVRQLEQLGAGQIHWVEKTPETEGSLLLMRRQMLATRPVACILIGGMEGVYSPGSEESEFALFTKLCPGRPVYPVAGPGGAARLLWDAISRDEVLISWKYASMELAELCGHVYPPLMERIVADIAAQVEH